MFLVIAVDVIKWVHNPFINDFVAVAIAVNYHMNSLIHMSHFAYACKMRYPLNLVLENIEYL